MRLTTYLILILILFTLSGSPIVSASPWPRSPFLSCSLNSSSNFELTWNESTYDIFDGIISIPGYNIYRLTTDSFHPYLLNDTNFIAQVSGTSYIDINALLFEKNFFYYITTVTAGDTESLLPSNIGYKIRIPLTFDPEGPNKHWLGLPYDINYSTANDLGADAPNISQVIRWDPVTQSEEIWNQIDGTGINFLITPGEAYAVVIAADTVINLVGVHNDITFNWTYNPDNFNTNWLSLPFPNAYGTASLLVQDIPNITKIARYDSLNNTYQSWFNIDGTWMGDDFSLIPGDPVLVVINADTTWIPSTGTPAVTASTDATDGLNTLTVNLSGTAEDKNGTITSYQWDYEGDGIFDFEDPSSPDTTFTYTDHGIFHPTLLVTDNDGFKNYAYQTIEMYALDAAFSVTNFNPSLGETIPCPFILSADGVMTVRVLDQNDVLIHTIALNQSVTAGEVTFEWNGKNDMDETVPGGIYYVVAEYAIAGKTFVYTHDLRTTTGGSDISGGITDIAVTGILSPLTGQSVDINYTLPDNALISIEVKNMLGIVIRHLITNAPRMSGPHIETWNGTNDNGDFIAPGTAFYVTVSAVSIAQNALIINGGAPELTNVTAAPQRFSPADNPYGIQDNSSVVVSFMLNKPADVTAMVLSPSGALIHTTTQTNIPAGAGLIIWNGRNENGALMSSDHFTIHLKASDGNGAYSKEFIIPVEVFY